eukprot:ANDGO_08385.mRNA.1 hypothetical protein
MGRLPRQQPGRGLRLRDVLRFLGLCIALYVVFWFYPTPFEVYADWLRLWYAFVVHHALDCKVLERFEHLFKVGVDFEVWWTMWMVIVSTRAFSDYLTVFEFDRESAVRTSLSIAFVIALALGYAVSVNIDLAGWEFRLKVLSLALELAQFLFFNVWLHIPWDGHGSHAEDVFMPETEKNVPEGHGRQNPDAFAPAIVENIPA